MSEIRVEKRVRSNGSASYQYRFEIASIDGQRKWVSKSGFKTKAEAKQAGKEAQNQYENYGRVVEKDEISYSDFLDYWLENDCEVDLKPSTIEGYRKRIDAYIRPKLGAYRLRSITKEILQAFLIDMYDAGFAYNSLTSLKGLLTKSLNFAVDRHYIAYSPALRLKIPKHKIPKIPTRQAPHSFIKPEIMQKVFERFPESSPSYIPLKLGYECGMRLGEVFGLCWEDVDFENKVIYVNRQVQWLPDTERQTLDKVKSNGTAECGNGYWYFSEPKYKSYRMIEISDELTELLIKERAKQLRAKEYYASFYTNYDVDKPLTFDGQEPESPVSVNRINKDNGGFPIHLVCIRENGTFISPRTMQHVSRIVKKEISNEFDFHSLRHTHASMLAELGVDPKYIQARLGHSDMKVTLGVYVHATDTMRSRGRKVINEIYM
ncbi:MAG: site-specific integrase [Clostridiales bacterium]|nr:site-specific integrase [Clostridiales bacterium]